MLDNAYGLRRQSPPERVATALWLFSKALGYPKAEAKAASAFRFAALCRRTPYCMRLARALGNFKLQPQNSAIHFSLHQIKTCATVLRHSRGRARDPAGLNGSMNLDDAQKKKVAEWIGQGMKLSEIQNRIGSEFRVRLTYMDVRFLVDDLKVLPKDPDPPRATPSSIATSPNAAAAAPGSDIGTAKTAAAGKVSLQVDTITRPGAIVSGKVTFTDGNTADWYLDQTGRLGFIPQQQGYRPPAPDLQQFQAALDSELSKLGF